MPNCRPECKNYTLYMTKMAKIDSLLDQCGKTVSFGAANTYISHKRKYSRGIEHSKDKNKRIGHFYNTDILRPELRLVVEYPLYPKACCLSHLGSSACGDSCFFQDTSLLLSLYLAFCHCFHSLNSYMAHLLSRGTFSRIFMFGTRKFQKRKPYGNFVVYSFFPILPTCDYNSKRIYVSMIHTVQCYTIKTMQLNPILIAYL